MRVAISGMAALTPIGHGLAGFAAGLCEGREGAAPIRRFDASRHRVQRAAEVDWEGPAESPWSRASEMALAVGAGALADAGLEAAELARSRTGVILASSQAGMAGDARVYGRLSHPYRQGPVGGDLAVRMLDAAPASTLDLLAIRCGASAFAFNLSTACSAGLHAIGIAREAIRRDEVDAVLVVGVEVLTEFALAGFGVLRALTTGSGPRPFDELRDGTLLGEGAAAVLVEAEERAQARGATPWAEIAGYGSSTDGDHMTRPQAAGAARAMAQALSGLHLEQVDWVKAHGTGTRHNDAAEAQAIHAVFGRRAAALPLTSMKSLLGHSLGASGVVEAVGVVLALSGGFVPPTRNCERPDPSLALDVVAGAARPLIAGCVLANAFGFGGNNAALVLRAA